MNKKTQSIANAVLSGLGVLTGLGSIVSGLGFKAISFAAGNVGSTELNSRYGGDAYTGIQNAAAQGATNGYYGNGIMNNLGTAVQDGINALGGLMSAALIVAGFALVAAFGIRLVKAIAEMNEAKQEEAAAAAEKAEAKKESAEEPAAEATEAATEEAAEEPAAEVAEVAEVAEPATTATEE